MIYYKTTKEDDPYIELWRRPEWLTPTETLVRSFFPPIITMEPTTNCQNDCLYCSRQLMHRKRGMLSLEVMEKVAIEAAKHRSAIRHGGFGEPLIHPKIKEIIAISGKHKVLTTIFTNGRYLDEDKMRSFIESGLDEIRFSSTGISPEEHNQVRTPSDFYRDFDSKIKLADRIKKEMGSQKPFLTVFTHCSDYEDATFKSNVEKYKNYFLQYADKVDIVLTNYARVKHLDRTKELYKKQTVKEIHKPCINLFLKILIHWNGDVFACDLPYNFEESHFLGNVMDDGFTIEAAYNSEKMTKLRNELYWSKEPAHEQYHICKDCYLNTDKWEDLDWWRQVDTSAKLQTPCSASMCE